MKPPFYVDIDFDDYPLRPASKVVYYRIIRRSSGSEGVCRESLNSIARTLMIGRRPLDMHLQILIGAGLIEEVVSKKGLPHRFRPLSKDNWVTHQEVYKIRTVLEKKYRRKSLQSNFTIDENDNSEKSLYGKNTIVQKHDGTIVQKHDGTIVQKHTHKNTRKNNKKDITAQHSTVVSLEDALNETKVKSLQSDFTIVQKQDSEKTLQCENTSGAVLCGSSQKLLEVEHVIPRIMSLSDSLAGNKGIFKRNPRWDVPNATAIIHRGFVDPPVFDKFILEMLTTAIGKGDPIRSSSYFTKDLLKSSDPSEYASALKDERRRDKEEAAEHQKYAAEREIIRLKREEYLARWRKCLAEVKEIMKGSNPKMEPLWDGLHFARIEEENKCLILNIKSDFEKTRLGNNWLKEEIWQGKFCDTLAKHFPETKGYKIHVDEKLIEQEEEQ